MAKFNIIALNKISVGKNEKIIDLDYEVYPETYERNLIGDVETEASAIVSPISQDSGDYGIHVITSEIDNEKYQALFKETKYKNAVYALDISKNDSLVLNNVNYTDNLFSLFQVKANGEKGIIIHNMYDVKDVCIQSAIKNYNKIVDIPGMNAYVDIFAPDLSQNLIGIAYEAGYAYGLTQKINDQPTVDSTNLLELRKKSNYITDSSWKYELKPANGNLNLYPSSENDLEISAYYNPVNEIKIKNNYVLEIPLSFGDFNQYYEGNIFGDIYRCKNEYNSLYSMEMSSQNSLSKQRDYSGIGACGGQVFLTYFDYDNNNNKTWQKVETISYANRMTASCKHRSTLYSLNIDNTGINELDATSETSEIKTAIIKDIENNIRGFVKKICPATTELFKIGFSD